MWVRMFFVVVLGGGIWWWYSVAVFASLRTVVIVSLCDLHIQWLFFVLWLLL